MRFRTKLYIALFVTAIISSSLAICFVYAEARRLTMNHFKHQIGSIVVTGTPFIDGNLVKELHVFGQMNTESYRKIQAQLEEIRLSNQHKDLHLQNVYTMFLNPAHPSQLLIGVETKADPSKILPPGTPYTAENEDSVVAQYGNFFVTNAPSPGTYGTWFSAFAPIYDSSSHIIGMLGVDIDGTNLYEHLDSLMFSLIISLAAALIIGILLGFLLSHHFTKSLTIVQNTVEHIAHGDYSAKAHLKSKDEFNFLAEAVHEMGIGLRERQQIKDNFSRHVSFSILEKILLSPPKIEAEKRKITALFADIRAFTKVTEHLSPEHTVHFLNDYFEKMVSTIFKYKGMLDNFRGDGLFIVFGLPFDDKNQEHHALEAAFEMQQAVANLNAKWGPEGCHPFVVDIGICTGMATIGFVGTEEKVQYRAIGYPLSIAQKIEKIIQNTDSHHIGISDSTYQACQDIAIAEEIQSIVLEKPSKEIKIFSAVPKPPDPTA